jgi:benzoylformate decarboxylase
MDDMAVELTDKEASDIAVVRTRTVAHAGGFPDKIATDIATRLNNAKSPALIVGGDVERFGAWDAVIALAERTQSVVLTAPLTGLSGFPENHPLYHGSLAPGAGWISKALTGRDLVVVIGAPVFRYYPQIAGPYLPECTSLIHLTNDPDEAARAPVGDAIVADLRSAAEAVLSRVDQTSRNAPAPRDPVTDPGSVTAPFGAGSPVVNGRTEPTRRHSAGDRGRQQRIPDRRLRPAGAPVLSPHRRRRRPWLWPARRGRCATGRTRPTRGGRHG